MPSTNPVMFLANETNATVSVTIINDRIFEDDIESFSVTLTSSTPGIEIGPINETTVNIEDDEEIIVTTDIAITEVLESNDVVVMVNITTPEMGLAVNITVNIDVVITDITTEGELIMASVATQSSIVRLHSFGS